MANKITHADVRMYNLGTGDCFIVKFFQGNVVKFKMMIDGGFWKYRKVDREDLEKKLLDLRDYVEGKIDLLVITHEHLDHVQAFEKFPDLFINDFEITQAWMAWSEDDGDKRVERWKKEYGDKKKALSEASLRIASILKNDKYKKSFEGDLDGEDMFSARNNYSEVLSGFADLHMSLDGKIYVPGLKGMKVVKEDLVKDKTRYLEPGEILENIPGLPGMKVYVLGPPADYRYVKRMEGEGDETYDHNKDLQNDDLLAVALTSNGGDNENILPFDVDWVDEKSKVRGAYRDKEKNWRKIDHDWLFSAGSMALRMNSKTNNLSLVLAFEFEDSKKVMLFPGDAEYGSWRSWHRVKWKDGSDKSLAEDLLNRTVFYKVAHHLSHNGTAKKEGLDLMKHPDLTCMAAVNYSNISESWTNTMPNKAIVKDILQKSKGRLIIMDEKDMFYDKNDQISLSGKIQETRDNNPAVKSAFDNNYSFDKSSLKMWKEYRVEG